MEQQSLSQRETYSPSSFTKFLWWLSTAEKELLIHCRVDRNRYAITGMAVLGTWLFATLAWSYFFSTVVHAALPSLALGIFMGLIILSIDRALIKGITAASKRKTAPLVFRLALALTIGTFMAQPALLYLFDKEIHVQISLDNEQRRRTQAQALDSVYQGEINRLQQEKNGLQQQLATRYAEVQTSRNAFIAETDGTGGSGKVGMKDIARAKQQEYIKLDTAYKSLEKALNPRLMAIDSSMKAIEKSKQADRQAFATLLNDGFLTRIEALHHLIENNSAAQFRYYLLVIILVLIELMPVIAKTILPDGTYDEKVRLTEIMEKKLAETSLDHELRMTELYNRLAFEQDEAFLRQFFEAAREERGAKLKKSMERWKDSESSSFDKIWQHLKRDILSKQEN